MTAIISIHTLHDANVSILVDGKLKAVLELERYFDVRYFCSNPRKAVFIDQWKKAIEVVTNYAEITEFDIAVTSWVAPSQRNILKGLVSAKKWVTVEHHTAHSAIGFYDSPFNKALIFSYDGGGDDGAFNIYLGDRIDGIQHLEWVGLNLGTAYRQLAMSMPEVTNEKIDTDTLTSYMRFSPLAYSGKIMGYAALGKVKKEWLPDIRDYYIKFLTPLTSVFGLGEKLDLVLEMNSLDDSDARDLAATSQYAFSHLVLEKIEEHWPTFLKHGCDGIVLTGGCALNVHTNQLVVEKFGVPVHVPPAPNDCGISVGAAWNIDPPKEPQNIQYGGLPCWDITSLPQLILDRDAKKVTPKEVAELLLGGSLVAVVRGRQEFGPRALGNRSMLCYPDRAELKEKINKLKSREWFRPLCPSVALESVPKMFIGRKSSLAVDAQLGDVHDECEIRPNCKHLCIGSVKDNTSWTPTSPYMSFAPLLTEEARSKFPAICHFDGTARLQTVRKEDNEWYHSLLSEIADLNGGYGIVLNTSFNVKGKPILNRISTALDILDTSPEGTLDYLVIEDMLFEAQRK